MVGEEREWGVRTPTGTAPPSFIQRSGRLVEVVVRAPQPRQLETRVVVLCVPSLSLSSPSFCFSRRSWRPSRQRKNRVHADSYARSSNSSLRYRHPRLGGESSGESAPSGGESAWFGWFSRWCDTKTRSGVWEGVYSVIAGFEFEFFKDRYRCVVSSWQSWFRTRFRPGLDSERRSSVLLLDSNWRLARDACRCQDFRGWCWLLSLFLPSRVDYQRQRQTLDIRTWTTVPYVFHDTPG